jgi:hypothetical protein
MRTPQVSPTAALTRLPGQASIPIQPQRKDEADAILRDLGIDAVPPSASTSGDSNEEAVTPARETAQEQAEEAESASKRQKRG